jgi:hypothetical protein
MQMHMLSQTGVRVQATARMNCRILTPYEHVPDGTCLHMRMVCVRAASDIAIPIWTRDTAAAHVLARTPSFNG